MIPLFVDIVSKNGNLLLSIPLPGHGEPDSDEIAFLHAMSAWHAVNHEAIKGSRPWKIYGEGPSTKARQARSYQLDQLHFDHRDIRFTTKGDTLYAIALGWPPERRFTIASLREGSALYPGRIGKVELLGSNAALRWQRTGAGLEIEAPGKAPSDYAVSFRINPA